MRRFGRGANGVRRTITVFDVDPTGAQLTRALDQATTAKLRVPSGYVGVGHPTMFGPVGRGPGTGGPIGAAAPLRRPSKALPAVRGPVAQSRAALLALLAGSR